MKNYVKGQLVGESHHLSGEFQAKLEGLGYQVFSNRFQKNGQIESIVNELVPYAERQGYNVFQDLYLEEYSSEGELVGKYEKGKVTRFET